MDTSNARRWACTSVHSAGTIKSGGSPSRKPSLIRNMRGQRALMRKSRTLACFQPSATSPTRFRELEALDRADGEAASLRTHKCQFIFDARSFSTAPNQEIRGGRALFNCLAVVQKRRTPARSSPTTRATPSSRSAVVSTTSR